jgi:BlaI family penicillinase repressor
MQISDAEWIVMNLIWQSQPMDARQVVEQLAEANGWSAATVKTMLHRLIKKGALTHEVDGKKYLYRASVRRGDCVGQASRSFLDRVFGGQAAPALLHLVKTTKLSPEDVAQLQALLDSKDLKNKGSKE